MKRHLHHHLNLRRPRRTLANAIRLEGNARAHGRWRGGFRARPYATRHGGVVCLAVWGPGPRRRRSSRALSESRNGDVGVVTVVSALLAGSWNRQETMTPRSLTHHRRAPHPPPSSPPPWAGKRGHGSSRQRRGGRKKERRLGAGGPMTRRASENLTQSDLAATIARR